MVLDRVKAPVPLKVEVLLRKRCREAVVGVCNVRCCVVDVGREGTDAAEVVKAGEDGGLERGVGDEVACDPRAGDLVVVVCLLLRGSDTAF
jgi:hypothetical protein